MTVELSEVEGSVVENKSQFRKLSGPYLKLEIGDTGHGIEKKYLRRIFDPYFTAKDIGKGTGLGLSMVDGIVKKHNGCINVRSVINEGTTFQIFWPVVKQEYVKALPDSKEMDVYKGTENVMLIDDEKDIINTFQIILEGQGYQITSFNDGYSALKAFEKNPLKFDLIATDMTMPRMTGDKLSEEILKIRKDIPIILCTGFSEKISDSEALRLGVRKYLEKPVAVKDLLASIREILDSH